MEYVNDLIVFVRRDTLEKSRVLKKCFMKYCSGEPMLHV